jgi:hypothetical protein
VAAAPDPVPVPAKTGASCNNSAGCQSTLCQAYTCRAPTGNLCAADVECEMGHVCCPSLADKDRQCSGGDRKCLGNIGARCTADADCGSGECLESTWCTMDCTSNAQCGVSPWGDANACETNGLGKRVCFPGCSSDTECYSNLGARFSCYSALDSTASICAID